MNNPIFVTAELDTLLAAALVKRRSAEDATLKRLLGRWVSEIEPAIAFDRSGNILGLTIADAPVGSHPFMLEVD